MLCSVTIFATFLATSSASPVVYPAVPTSSQYHSQDGLGQYSYGYSEPLSAKSEIRSADGVTRGGYSFYDAEGKLRTVQYVADPLNGFQVVASDIPDPARTLEQRAVELEQLKPVEDTPEVAAVKAEHLAAVEEVKARLAEAERNSVPGEEEEEREEVVNPVSSNAINDGPAPVAYSAVPAPMAFPVPAAYSYSYTTLHDTGLEQPVAGAYATPLIR
ncbi:cuticle protein 7-like [Agrilus planipennis]|uniref:Cuticle protein 7-like n=1 Tax=Agrilus planipennis TaxID=224129 RepID=A0A1W4WP92_AGRPL|nr:cuticle protein 7-like [Agrilus planipennis]